MPTSSSPSPRSPTITSTNRKAQKIKKADGAAPTLELAENPDILASVAALKGAPFCVGFAAESENLREYAQAKRKKKGIR